MLGDRHSALTVTEARSHIEMARRSPTRTVYDRTISAHVLAQFCLIPWRRLDPERRWQLLVHWTVPGMSVADAREILEGVLS